MKLSEKYFVTKFCHILVVFLLLSKLIEKVFYSEQVLENGTFFPPSRKLTSFFDGVKKSVKHF